MLQIHNYVFVFSFLQFSFAAVFIEAPCPEIRAVENFDFTKFAGGWFQIARYPNDFEKGGDCVSAFIKFENGQYLFVIKETADGKLNKFEGYYKMHPDAGTSAIINAFSEQIKEEGVDQVFPFHVVALDYENYSIGFECRYNETTKMRHDYAWVWTRSKTLDEESKKSLDNALKSIEYIDKDKFIWDNFTEESCKVIS